MPSKGPTKLCSKCQQLLPLASFYRRKDTGRLFGVCKTCVYARVKRYRTTPAGRALRKREQARYRASPHGKAVRQRWLSSPTGKVSRQRTLRKWNTSKKGHRTKQRWRESLKGRQWKEQYPSSERYRVWKKEYERSPQGIAAKKRYDVSDKAKARVRRYYESDKGRAWRGKYKMSGKRADVLRSYNQSPKGRESAIRGVTRRQRAMEGVRVTLTADEWRDILHRYDYRCVYCGKRSGRLTRDHVLPISRGGHHVKENIVPACQSCNAKKGNRVLA